MKRALLIAAVLFVSCVAMEAQTPPVTPYLLGDGSLYTDQPFFGYAVTPDFYTSFYAAMQAQTPSAATDAMSGVYSANGIQFGWYYLSDQGTLLVFADTLPATIAPAGALHDTVAQSIADVMTSGLGQ